jgi:serine/threonine protein phosphatase PrpC
MSFLHPVATESIGARATMEDRYVAARLPRDLLFGAVMDGHGGAAMAEYARRTLPLVVADLSKTKEGGLPRDRYAHTGDLLAASFDVVDRMSPVAMDPRATLHTGCTTVAAVLDAAQQEIWCANCGDALALLIRHDGSFLPMSQEHKAARAGPEAERIRQAGGDIVCDAYGTPRVVEAGLNITRSMGDHASKTWIISQPFVCRVRLDASCWAVLLASDGLYDVFKYAEVAALLHAWHTGKEAHPRDMLERLDTMARERGSTDNITLLLLPCAAAAAATSTSP